MTSHLELRFYTGLALALVVVPTLASAHGMDAGRVTVELEDRAIMVVATPKATSFAFADDSGDGRLTRLEVKAHRAEIRAAFDAALVLVDEQGRRPRCERTDVSTPVFTDDPSESADHVRVTARCEFDAAPTAIALSYAFASDEPVVVEAVRLAPRSSVAGRPSLPVRIGAGERVALASGDAVVRMLTIQASARSALVPSGAGPADGGRADGGQADGGRADGGPASADQTGAGTGEPNVVAPRTVGLMGFVRHGVSHVLYGLDHILFILALVLSTTRRRDLFAAITAFTVMHTVALAVVVTGGMAAPSSAWIEPAIALSIAVTAALVAFAPRHAAPSGRSLARLSAMAAVFGVVHGLGMASSALDTFHEAAADMLVPFTVGAEAAQLTIAALASALSVAVLTAGRRRAAAWALVAVGLSWFVIRLDAVAPDAGRGAASASLAGESSDR